MVENGSTDRASDPIIPLTLALCSRFHQFFLNSSPTFQPEQVEVWCGKHLPCCPNSVVFVSERTLRWKAKSRPSLLPQEAKTAMEGLPSLSWYWPAQTQECHLQTQRWHQTACRKLSLSTPPPLLPRDHWRAGLGIPRGGGRPAAEWAAPPWKWGGRRGCKLSPGRREHVC